MNLKTIDYINRLKNIFGNKYDYSLICSDIKNQKLKILIRCIKHNYIFKASVNHLLEGHGCPKCKADKLHDLKAFTTEQFQSKLDDKFGPIYKSLTPYINNHTKITCLCLKCNTTFTRNPSTILDGVGCSNCNSSKLEQQVNKLLYDNKYEYIREKTFDWLPNKRFDFYIPSLNVCIECHGEQHFIAKEFFGGIKGLQNLQISDKLKYDACKNHDIKILYYADKEYEYFAPIITTLETLLNYLK